ncbi:L,D-transpeptidase family protein [Pseudahrensia aquimaris]|uniref:L,D-transpeptidase family protein n=1 Tax=Pseudahrensia aquimaris TaxID=744461 RepID=A0ABW3F9Z3_9HYPH
MNKHFKRSLFASAIGLALLGAPALAQDYDIFIDDYGRRVLVDPYTGEVLRVIPRSQTRAFMREQRRMRQLEREERRERRRAKLRRELDRVLGWDDDRNFEDETFDDRPRQPGGFYLDEYEDRQRAQRNREPEPFDDRVERAPLAEPRDDGDRLARLPEPSDVAPQLERARPSRPDWYFTKPDISKASVAKLQIFLDREGFSPGVIDGAWGENMVKALRAWQEAKGSNADLTNPLVLEAMIKKSGDGFKTYRITRADVAGPFVASIPIDYGEKARMESMAFTSPLEKLAERFHMSEAYLRRLNPGADFNSAGTTIRVVDTGSYVKRKVHYILADKAKEQVRAYDRNGGLVAAYPATIGSAATPSPSGKVEISRIALDPNYTYNPQKNFKQGDNDKVLTIPPGPNGPVGSVWIALSKPTYGIHGTPNPDKIGKTNSYGCIRLTNWDARELAGLVREGVTVEFVE